MNTPRTPTPVLIKALESLSRDVQSEDGVANAALFEAAKRMGEMQDALRRLVDVGCEMYDMDCGEEGCAAIFEARKALGDDSD